VNGIVFALTNTVNRNRDHSKKKENFLMDLKGIFSDTFNRLEKNLDIRSERHKLIVSNIANMDTPGYKAFDLIVEEEMKKVEEHSHPFKMARTHPAHIKEKSTLPNMFQYRNIRSSDTTSTNGNTVDMDKEMGKLSENNLLFNVTAQILTKKLSILKAAIDGGKK
jgi:flagellar basal-body rod protein FlgB